MAAFVGRPSCRQSHGPLERLVSLVVPLVSMFFGTISWPASLGHHLGLLPAACCVSPWRPWWQSLRLALMPARLASNSENRPRVVNMSMRQALSWNTCRASLRLDAILRHPYPRENRRTRAASPSPRQCMSSVHGAGALMSARHVPRMDLRASFSPYGLG